jgi:hypothetical protein
LESTREKEFRRMLAKEIEHSYDDSRIPRGHLQGLMDFIPRGYQDSTILLGFHSLGKLTPPDAVEPSHTWYTNTEQ